MGAKGPCYCPSIEDKVVRFADKDSHQARAGSVSTGIGLGFCNGPQG